MAVGERAAAGVSAAEMSAPPGGHPTGRTVGESVSGPLYLADLIQKAMPAGVAAWHLPPFSQPESAGWLRRKALIDALRRA